MAFRVRGDKELAAALEKSPKEFRREVRKVFPRSGRRVKKELGRTADSFFPDNYAAELRRTLSVRTTAFGGVGIGANVQVSGRTDRGGRRDLRALNEGRLRHPTHGHKPWVTQRVRAGWGDDAFKREEVDVRKDVADTVDAVVKRVNRGN